MFVHKVHATATEEYLQGKTLNNATLQGALMILGGEVKPDELPLRGSPEYRRGLTQSFLYRVTIMSTNRSPRTNLFHCIPSFKCLIFKKILPRIIYSASSA